MQGSGSLKILFLEDHSYDVELMVRELNKVNIKPTFKRVSTKADFLSELESNVPDIIISDYSLPMFNGMHAFRLFKEKNITIPFILVTGSLSEKVAAEFLSEGIDDFLLKSNYSRFTQVIQRCLDFKKNQREKDQMALELEKSKKELNTLKTASEKTKARELLSDREFEILCLIAKGKSIKEIAGELILSTATVATYRARVLEKMNFKSNVELTRYTILNKLID